MKKEILKYKPEYREQIIDVWERSARATHTFVSPEDFTQLKVLVQKIDFASFEVYCLLLDSRVIGFVGVENTSLETLFLHPDFIGKGFGKELVLFAINDLHAREVEVNEQNHPAVAFYQKFGFETYGRLDKSREGQDYPILQMKLRKRGKPAIHDIEIRLLNNSDAIPYELLLDADPSRDLVDRYMAKGETYLAVQANETVGVCVLLAVNEKIIEIKNLAVAEKMQGMGIGVKIIAHVLDIARSQGYGTILIATSTPNVGPLYLYQKMGFEYDYIVKNYFDNNSKHYNGSLYDNGIKCNHLIVLSQRID